MKDFLNSLRERRVPQWTLAYIAAGWVGVEVLTTLAEPWGIPASVVRIASVIVLSGVPAVAVVAWFHGARGRQGVSLVEVGLLAGIGAIALFVVAGILPRVGGDDETRGERAGPIASNSVAVLPCLDLSPGQDQRYFGDGIAVEVISALRRDGRVNVSGQSSSFAMRGRPAREVGRELGVAAVLECSVRTDARSMRIEAILSNAEDGFALWNREFDRPIDNILQTQAEIAAAVVREITGESTDLESAFQSIDPRAYRLYLQGRLAWDRRGEADMRLARDYFQRAIDIAPNFAAARAGIADTYAVMAFYNYSPPGEAFPAARREATEALRIDPEHPEATATLAYVSLYWDWDWSAAEAGFRRAIELADGYATAHQWLANVLVITGRAAEGTREFRHAFERDQGLMIARTGIGWTLYYERKFDEVVAHLDDVLQFDSRYMLAHYWRGWALVELGRFDEAIDSLQTAVRYSDGAAITQAALARAYARAGREAESRAVLERLEDPAQTPDTPFYEIGIVYASLSDPDAAFSWFDRAYDSRSLQLVFIAVEPAVDPLREDPRFQQLLEKLRLEFVVAPGSGGEPPSQEVEAGS